MTQAERRAQRIALAKIYMTEIINLVVFAMEQGIPEHEPAARAQLQQWMQTKFPATAQLEAFFEYLGIVELIVPNIRAVVQLEARRRLEATNADR